MGLFVEFDISDYGYVNEVAGIVADLIPFYVNIDFAPACEAFVSTFKAEAEKLVPVRTGYLKSTINATTDGFHCSAEATAEYAEYVEYGTWCMEAQPYFTPALEKAMDMFHKVAKQIQDDAMEQTVENVVAKADDLIANATDVILIIFLMILVMFIYEIIKSFFEDVFGSDDKTKLPLPEITIV